MPMSRVQSVNTTSIPAAIELGCRTMHCVFNADDDNVPFFSSKVRPETALGSCSYHSEAHVPGRHLNALLNAEDALGIDIDEKAVDNHRRAAFLSFNGKLPLPLNRQTIDAEPLNFVPHNLREGMHALGALVTFRDDNDARTLAERCIDTINDYWTAEDGWDVPRLEMLGLNVQGDGHFILGEGRMIGPLVKYYRATGYGPALELALVMKEIAVTRFFTADGSFDPDRFVTNHIHSITCVLSSLAQLADLLRDANLMSIVKAFYDNGLLQMRDEIGWSPEIVGQEGSDHGEANNSGDILETALILGRWGYAECYHDAERILRCHLLPCQVRDTSWIVDPPNPEGLDGLRNVADRHLGAFGFPAPYGHSSVGAGKDNGRISFNMDIVGGVVGSLCEAWREAVRRGPAGISVNLLFDVDNDAARLGSPYTNDCLAITPKHSGPLSVRMPPWLRPDDITIADSKPPRRRTGGYLFFSNVAAGETIRLQMPLVSNKLTLSGKLHIQPICVDLRGDSVATMENFGADLTYFDAV